MIVKTKSGNYQANTTNMLLDFLGIKKEAEGLQTISGDIELIASVPFCLSVDSDTLKGFPWTLSTFDLDRMGERIDPTGWDCKQYLKNPNVEWSHMTFRRLGRLTVLPLMKTVYMVLSFSMTRSMTHSVGLSGRE